MNKEDAYELATMQELGGNPNGTRHDVELRAMDIFSKSECLSLLQFLAEEGFSPNEIGNWQRSNDPIPYNKELLYDLYLEDKTQLTNT